MAPDLELARRTAAAVVDPELPMLTLGELGVLRQVAFDAGRVVIDITPTYTGCPALEAMSADLIASLNDAGFSSVEVRVCLSPPWSSDQITAEGRAALRRAGIAPPGPAPVGQGPIPLNLQPTVHRVRCPRCDSTQTEQVSAFGATSCKAMYRCRVCLEPFERFKEI